MKATLSFTLPEEQEEFDLALKGGHYKYAIDVWYEFIRSQVKYNSDGYTEAELAIFEKCREKMGEFLYEE